MANDKQFGILKISVSRFEFEGSQLIESFPDLEKAQEFIAADPEYQECHGNGWNDSYEYKLVEIREGAYFTLDGKQYNPEFGDSVV